MVGVRMGHASFVGVAGIAVGYWRLAYYLLPAVFLYLRIAGQRTSRWRTNLIAIAFGLPMFAYLLLRSKRAIAKRQRILEGADVF